MSEIFTIQSTFAPALLEALIHSLWIGGILYLLLRLYLDLSMAQAPASRYRVAVSALVTQVLLTVVLLKAIYQPQTVAADLQGWTRFADNFMMPENTAEGLAGAAGSNGRSWAMHPSDIALLVYFSGVLFFSFRMFIASTIIRKRIGLGSSATPQYIRLLERTRERIGIRRRIRMVISDHLPSPALYGFFRPVVIVPAGMLTHLSFAQVEAILLHELIHLKKADFLVNLFQQMVESFLFFNPFTWLISASIREEREKRVDDSVTVHSNAATYAKALFNLSLLHHEGSAAMMAATGGGQKLLLSRIQRILKVNQMKKSFKTRFYLSAMFAAGAILFISFTGFSSSLLHIDRQQTKAVQSIQQQGAAEIVGNSKEVRQDVHEAGIQQVLPVKEDPVRVATSVHMTVDADLEEALSLVLPGSDTLTEKEREELMEALEQARQELESIDLDEELSRLEEERERLLTELPAKLEEERLRVQQELSRIDQEMIREQMEQARRQIDSVRKQIDSGVMQQQIQQHVRQLEEKLRSGEYPDEKTREALEQSLDALQDINFDEMMINMQEAISDLDLDIDFDHDMDIDINFDSILIDVRQNLQEIDIEDIKADIEQSIKEIEMRMEELKSSDTKKNQKN